jgi:hypothetical protein
MRRNDEWHLFQDFGLARPTQCRPPPSCAARPAMIARDQIRSWRSPDASAKSNGAG